MGIQYLISDFETSSLKLEPQNFAQHLKDFDTAITLYDNPQIASLSWDVSGITGDVSLDKASVAISGDLKTVARFTVWFRQLIPAEIPLTILETSYEHGQLELSLETTIQDIVDYFT